MSSSERVRFVRLAALALVLAAGCRGEVELGNVEGTVTMDGKPLDGATVKFIPVNRGRPAVGMTGPDGRYELQYSATDSGALVGPMKVEITTGDPEQPKLFPETVPARYNTKSALTAEVGSGSNPFDFELQSK